MTGKTTVSHTTDIEECRARKIGVSDLVDCLVTPRYCRYALSFGYGCFCRHPLKEEIIRRTERNPNHGEERNPAPVASHT